MKIIGVKIDGGASVVIKNLEPGWYPFGKYDEPKDLESYHLPDWDNEIDLVYQLFPNLPHISVSSIVGRNGAGKTTMIDVILRIINNFSYCLLDGKADDNNDYHTDKGRKLSYAKGLKASLYFETDGNIGLIKCQNDDLYYSYYSKSSKKTVEYNNVTLSKIKNKDVILKNFFYTIECNYSQYGFRPADYEPIHKDNEINEQEINGDLIEGLFHKNDGYLSPAVLTPFRENGLIDYDQEERLANRRLITLAILYYTQNKQFIPGYNPSHLTFTFDKNFLAVSRDSLVKNTRVFNSSQISTLIECFQASWQFFLRARNRRSYYSEDEAYLLSYLGYKSLKICLKYHNYQRRFALKTFCKELEKGGDAFENYIRSENFHKRVNTIVKALYNDTSHIALKIHQCISFMDKDYRTNNNEPVSIDEYLKEITRHTYDNVFKALPPAYYSVELTMRHSDVPINKNMYDYDKYNYFSRNNVRNNEFHFSQMSSGERQLMNSMSYVLYHIKNIQSIKPDADRVAYHHINLIFDEAELYYHPDYQRYLVYRIIDMLYWCHIDRRRIRSVNIILATHSPYVLSDIFTEKSLYLQSGKKKEIKEQTFGANYYNMLQHSFFFDESPMGEIATNSIEEWIKKRDYDKALFVGDPLIKKYLEYQKKEYVQDL